jgi:hypothetical protein
MKKQFLSLLVFGLLVIVGCSKEESFETGSNPSDGSLKADATGDCLPKTVNGAYIVNTALVSATNTISVDVNVNSTGTYLVYTDTVNGYYFRTSGVFTQTGVQTVTLRGNGTPFSAGLNNFIVNYDSTQCDLAVTVLPAGTGNAVFTLAGAGGNCTGATVQGTYAQGIALNPTTNIVTITTNVTTIGTYNITTTYQGMVFAASGAFTSTGVNTVTLTGTGTPTTGGANVVPLTAGASTCNFTVNVTAPATGTLTCATLAVQGTYTAGTAVTAANTISVPVNFTSTGPYTISSNTVDGFGFTISGNATATGIQTITIPASGTPGSAGAKNFTLSFNGSTTGNCPFIVTVLAATGGAAVGTLGVAANVCTPATVNGIYYSGTATTGTNSVTVQLNVTTGGTYTINTNTVSGVSFSGSGNVGTGNQNVTLAASGTPAASGPQTFTVTWGTSTCTFVVNFLSNDYFPRTVGSNWSYENDDDATDSLYRYVIAPTHTANGNIYNIFMGNDGSGADSTGYYRKNGGDYIEWIDMAGYIGFDPPAQWTDYILLKDNVAQGTSWVTNGFTGVIQSTNYTIRLRFTINQKDVPITVNSSLGNVTYQNVIVVKEEIEANIGGIWTSLTPQIGYGFSYYAKGIGLIKYELFDASNVSQFLQELRRYQVL